MNTPYYLEFKNLLGPSVHNLNTICVGLEQIINGHHDKPNKLSISWSTKDCVNDAKRARRYAVNLFLVASIDAIENYIRSVCEIKGLIPDRIKTAINGANGLRAQVKELFKIFDSNTAGIEDFWLPSVRMLIGWRNIVVHKSKANVVLEHADESILLKYKKEIYDTHAATEIELTIEHYKNKEPPTLKDFSTLFTILLRAFKAIDQKIAFDIDAHTTKEMIYICLGNAAFNKQFGDDYDLKKLEEFCKKKQIALDKDMHDINVVKRAIIVKLADSKFNELTSDPKSSIKKIVQLCRANSIPCPERLLKDVLSISIK